MSNKLIEIGTYTYNASHTYIEIDEAGGIHPVGTRLHEFTFGTNDMSDNQIDATVKDAKEFDDICKKDDCNTSIEIFDDRSKYEIAKVTIIDTVVKNDQPAFRQILTYSG